MIIVPQPSLAEIGDLLLFLLAVGLVTALFLGIIIGSERLATKQLNNRGKTTLNKFDI